MNQIVVLSGGLDSTSVLALACQAAKAAQGSVKAFSFDYGQRHSRELEAARQIAQHYGVAHQVVSLRGLMHGSALLGETPVPEGHYAEESMAQTVVSGRNLLFASVAIAKAELGDSLWFGVHAGDHPIYPDCRPEFWSRLASLAQDAYGVRLETPFLVMSKAEALRSGARLGAPYALTWSCYNGGEVHCGRCGTCVERAEAFSIAGIIDPTEYADSTFWRRVTQA